MKTLAEIYEKLDQILNEDWFEITSQLSDEVVGFDSKVTVTTQLLKELDPQGNRLRHSRIDIEVNGVPIGWNDMDIEQRMILGRRVALAGWEISRRPHENG